MAITIKADMNKVKLNLSSVARRSAFLGSITSIIRTKACQLCVNDDKILDVGCGNGLFFAELNQLTIKGESFIGIDCSEDLLNEAKRIFLDNSVKKAVLIRGDIFALPFEKRGFKRITCLNTILNIPNIEKVEKLLTEMMNICSFDGKIVIDVRNKSNPYIRLKYWQHSINGVFPTIAYRLQDIRLILRKHGFHIAKCITIGIPFSITAWAFVLEIERVK